MSTVRKDLLLAIAAGSCRVEIGTDEMGAMLSVLETGTLFVGTTPDQGGIGAKMIANVQDSNGDLLVAGRNYMFRGEKVKVLREKFGNGNCLDTYYFVYYLGSDLEDHFECVEVSYEGGIFGSRIYKSAFEPISVV